MEIGVDGEAIKTDYQIFNDLKEEVTNAKMI